MVIFIVLYGFSCSDYWISHGDFGFLLYLDLFGAKRIAHLFILQRNAQILQSERSESEAVGSLAVVVQDKEKRRKKRKKKEFLVLMPFVWIVKLDRCQNFK